MVDLDAIIDQAATEDVTSLLQAEDELQAYTSASDYDSVYGAIARKSMRRAKWLDENLSVARAIKKVMIGIDVYAAVHHCTVNDLEVTTKMSVGGHILVSIHRV